MLVFQAVRDKGENLRPVSWLSTVVPAKVQNEFLAPPNSESSIIANAGYSASGFFSGMVGYERRIGNLTIAPVYTFNPGSKGLSLSGFGGQASAILPHGVIGYGYDLGFGSSFGITTASGIGLS